MKMEQQDQRHGIDELVAGVDDASQLGALHRDYESAEDSERIGDNEVTNRQHQQIARSRSVTRIKAQIAHDVRSDKPEHRENQQTDCQIEQETESHDLADLIVLAPLEKFRKIFDEARADAAVE